MDVNDSYKKWNSAIIDYVTHGLTTDKPVFLFIDDEIIEIVGLMSGEDRPPDGWRNDFVRCVKMQHVRGGRISIQYPWRDREGQPRYVPFLAFMVLVASYMGDGQDDRLLSPIDYFTHFNELAGLEAQRGRPEGLRPRDGVYVDEQLWFDWSSWLYSQGLWPTILPNETVDKKVDYAISQALLRQSGQESALAAFYADALPDKS